MHEKFDPGNLIYYFNEVDQEIYLVKYTSVVVKDRYGFKCIIEYNNGESDIVSETNLSIYYHYLRCQKISSRNVIWESYFEGSFAYLTVILLILGIPIIISHVIPGLCMYLWVILVPIAALSIILIIIAIGGLYSIHDDDDESCEDFDGNNPCHILVLLIAACIFAVVALPAFVLFGILFIGYYCCCCGYYEEQLESEDNSMRKISADQMDSRTKLMVDTMCQLLIIVLIQTFANYATLVYTYPLPLNSRDYLNVIVREYVLRTENLCYIMNGLADIRSGLVLFSWL